jgi:spermidine/putrescine transport system permease protein
MSGTGEAYSRRRWTWPAFAAPGLLWLILLFLVPFYAILAVAMGRRDPIFNTAEPVWNPVQWDPGIFGEVVNEIFTGQLGVIFTRTVAYVAIASLISLLIGYPVAYFVARHSGRRKILYLVLILTPFWIPYLMRMLAWVNLLESSGYVNDILTFIGFQAGPRDWLGGQPETVVMGLVYGYVPFLILPLFAALDRIDQSTIQAARDLGASPFRAFLHVTLPLSKQGILAGLVIIMLPMFGDYYTNNLLSKSPRTRMIGNEIDLFINSNSGESQGATITVLLMGMVGVLMAYYLISVARATREARA